MRQLGVKLTEENEQERLHAYLNLILMKKYRNQLNSYQGLSACYSIQWLSEDT
jgi:hypothetical protein